MPRRPLLGNWFEEEAYAADRRRLMQGRNGGSVDARVEVARVRGKCAHHRTAVELAAVAAEDGLLRFYAPLQLRNVCTGGLLSIDLDDRQRTATGWQVLASTDGGTSSSSSSSNSSGGGGGGGADVAQRIDGASATARASATLRNTVVLVPAAAALTDSLPVPVDEAEVVHYGQPFYIMTLPSLCEHALSLLSEARSPSSASNVTGTLQRVYFSPDGGTAGALWCLDYIDEDYRADMRDRPARADAVVLLRHHMTSAPLASLHDAVYYNDFGAQHEVGCGRLTEYASRRKAGPYRSENYWTFVHAAGDGGDGAYGGEEASTTTTPPPSSSSS